MTTPIATDIHIDLNISPTQTHSLLQSLVALVGKVRECSFDEEKVTSIIAGKV